jgi:hypothetical protein
MKCINECENLSSNLSIQSIHGKSVSWNKWAQRSWTPIAMVLARCNTYFTPSAEHNFDDMLPREKVRDVKKSRSNVRFLMTPAVYKSISSVFLFSIYFFWFGNVLSPVTCWWGPLGHQFVVLCLVHFSTHTITPHLVITIRSLSYNNLIAVIDNRRDIRSLARTPFRGIIQIISKN